MDANLSTLVLSLIGSKHMTDIVETEAGFLALHNPEIAELAYEIKINNPIEKEGLEYILSIANGACPQALGKIYNSFNGLDLRMSTFSIYGYRSSLSRADFYSVQNVPFDIEGLQTFDRPEFAPTEGCIVASYGTLNDESSIKQFDVVCADGRIASGFFEEASEIIEMYTGVEEWLQKRVSACF